MSTRSDVESLPHTVENLLRLVFRHREELAELKARLDQRDAQHYNDRSIQRDTSAARLKLVVSRAGEKPIHAPHNLPALNTLQDLVDLDMPTVKRYLAFYGVDEAHPYLAQYGHDACLEMYLRGDPALLG
ncbi:hypothetical protein JCM1841_000215 [Sporobolomyces salmonicolor]